MCHAVAGRCLWTEDAELLSIVLSAALGCAELLGVRAPAKKISRTCTRASHASNHGQHPHDRLEHYRLQVYSFAQHSSCIMREVYMAQFVKRRTFTRAAHALCVCSTHIVENACVGTRVARITLPREAVLANETKSSSTTQPAGSGQLWGKQRPTCQRAPRDGFFSVSCAVPAVPRHASDKGDWQLLVKAWLGSICDARHRLVLCVTEKEVRRYDVSLFGVVDFCAVPWPVNRMPCGVGKPTIELARSVKDIPFLHTTCSKHATPCAGHGALVVLRDAALPKECGGRAGWNKHGARRPV